MGTVTAGVVLSPSPGSHDRTHGHLLDRAPTWAAYLSILFVTALLLSPLLGAHGSRAVRAHAGHACMALATTPHAEAYCLHVWGVRP